MLYETLLLIGAVGLVAQTILGMAGHGGHGHDHSGAHAHGIDFELPHGHMGHAGPGVGHHGGTTAPTGPTATGHNSAHCQANGHSHMELSVSQRAMSALWTLFSPLTIFSICIGAGATGILIRALLGKPLFVALAAIVGGVLFYSVFVKPLWGLIFKFASKPAETLSGAVAREAVAMGRFDAEGQGIVRITIDGEYVRLLARLDREDREKGIAVLSGDKLVVTSVDEKRNRCVVTRL